MNLFQICFSPAGGTRRVADALAGYLSPQKTVFVDLTARDEDFSKRAPSKNDLVLIAVPCFGGRVPALAAERLSRIRGRGNYAVLACVYGNRAFEDALLELGDLSRKAGFRPLAAVAAVAEHSVARKYAAGRPDLEDLDQLHIFANGVRNKLGDGILDEPPIPGNRPYRQAGKSAIVPRATGDCLGCGECARLCPAGAIDPADPKTVDPGACVSCMRCVRVCPRQARRVDARMLAMVEKMLEEPCAERKNYKLFF